MRRAIVLLGPPGSGKTTLAGRLSKRPGVEAFETGKILRQEAVRGTALGKRIERYLRAGRLAPSGAVEEVLEKKMRGSKSRTIFFDGFPRKVEEIKVFDVLCGRYGFTLSSVIIFELSHAEAARRLSGRRVCPRCHAIYAASHEGLCRMCLIPLAKRNDDAGSVIQERLREFEQETVPVIEYFKRTYPSLTHIKTHACATHGARCDMKERRYMSKKNRIR